MLYSAAIHDAARFVLDTTISSIMPAIEDCVLFGNPKIATVLVPVNDVAKDAVAMDAPFA